MRSLWILSGSAAVLSIAALIVSGYALISFTSEESDGDLEKSSIHLVDRSEFTVDIVLKAIEMYDERSRDATLEYFSSPESADGESYVFVFDEKGNNVAHMNPDVWDQNLNDDLGVDSAG